MIARVLLLSGLFAMSVLAGRIAGVPVATPIGLHPQNPHYFLFRHRPAVLITSGEHYGAVTFFCKTGVTLPSQQKKPSVYLPHI